MKQLNVGLIVALTLVSPAAAACPPRATGSTPETIADNGLRLLCLQDELAEEIARRTLEFELQTLENKIYDIQLQQRLNALPRPVVPIPVFK